MQGATTNEFVNSKQCYKWLSQRNGVIRARAKP